MNQRFILNKLSQVLKWDDETAEKEFARTELMARLKYDQYQDFLAGARFVERLVDWLQQFRQEDRAAAYAFVRSRLIFISTAEMNHLVELFYPEVVEPRIVTSVAERLGLPTYRIWVDEQGQGEFAKKLRKSLFVELSDGGRVDLFRRANAGIISNEQIVTAPQIHEEKWAGLLQDLQDDLKDENAKFAFIFLLDDFTASGTSLIRKPKDSWKGKLPRFRESIRSLIDSHFDEDFVLHVHHYLATELAVDTIKDRHKAIAKELGCGEQGWFAEEKVEFSYGSILPDSSRVEEPQDSEFLRLVENYYDASLDKKRQRHLEQSGINTLKHGYGDCKLPLVIDHNTPNNSFPLIWFESGPQFEGHSMRALFRRRERHI